MKDQILNRLKKNFKHRKKWAKKNNFEAFRIYEKDLPDFPFLVDIYKDYAVIFFKGDKRIDEEKGHEKLIIEAIHEVCSIEIDKILYKERFIQDDESKYKSSYSRDDIEFIINEGELKFIVNLTRYIDTGLFLDHRPLRQKLITEATDQIVLNLFSYTGSLSIASAINAKHVTSVDLSNTYLDWSQKNFELNGINPINHTFIREDVLVYLKSKSFREFDMIIIDPPTFSTSKKMEWTLDIQRDHEEIIYLAMNLLNDDGKIYFSNNLRSFKISNSLLEKFNVKEITKWSIPEDFRDGKIHCLFEISRKSSY